MLQPITDRWIISLIATVLPYLQDIYMHLHSDPCRVFLLSEKENTHTHTLEIELKALNMIGLCSIHPTHFKEPYAHFTDKKTENSVLEKWLST